MAELLEPAAVQVALAKGVKLSVDADGETIVSVADAAKLTGFAKRTVHGWVQRGLVDVRRTPTGLAWIVVRSLWKRDVPTSPETGAAA